MKTIRDAINEIPDKDIKNWIFENVDRQDNATPLEWKYDSPKKSPYDFIDILFTWYKTKQGVGFWQRLNYCECPAKEIPQIKADFPHLPWSDRVNDTEKSLKEKVFDFLDSNWNTGYTAEQISNQLHENVNEVRQALMELSPALSVKVVTYYAYNGYKLKENNE